MRVKGGIAVAASIGLAIATAAQGQSAPDPPPAPAVPKMQQLCGLTAPSAAAFEPQVAALPGIARWPDKNGYRVYADEANRRVWDFTTPAIAGHPAAACISVVSKGSGSDITVDIVCEGKQADCNTVAASFQDLAAHVAGAR